MRSVAGLRCTNWQQHWLPAQLTELYLQFQAAFACKLTTKLPPSMTAGMTSFSCQRLLLSFE